MGANVNTEFLNLFVNDWFLLSDMADFLCGGFIGNGCSRSVYDFNLDPSCVIKIDRTGFSSNYSEWELWNNLKDDKKISRYLAPCIRISSCGRILLQKKTTPIIFKQLPKSIPDFFSDFKLQNWGMLDGKVVCHDYANHSLYRTSRIKMFEPEWWSDSYQVKNWKKENS